MGSGLGLGQHITDQKARPFRESHGSGFSGRGEAGILSFPLSSQPGGEGGGRQGGWGGDTLSSQLTDEDSEARRGKQPSQGHISFL